MTRRHTLTLADYQALAEFRYQLRRFIRFSEESARRVGLEPQQHQLMLAVKAMPHSRAARIADLAERLQLQHHSVVELVSRLVAKGLIQKVRGDEDRREVQVRLTMRGEGALNQLTLRTRAELRLAVPALVSSLRKIAVRAGSRRIGGNKVHGKSRIATEGKA